MQTNLDNENIKFCQFDENRLLVSCCPNTGAVTDRIQYNSWIIFPKEET